MEQLLLDLGINLAASAIWDVVKNLTSSPNTQNQLEEKLTEELIENQVDLENAKIKSKEIIEFLIENGALKLNGAIIYSDTSIVQKTEGNSIVITKNSSFTTPNTQIKIVGEGAVMKQQGNVEIKQGLKGISISVGKKK